MKTNWQELSTIPALSNKEVHVWRFVLEAPSERLASLFQTLAAEERRRAERFHFVKDRVRYIVGRGLLRHLLGGYLRVSPAQVVLEYTPYGKPYLPNETGPQALRFNLSHSGEWAVLAVTRGREIGVDIEQVRRDVDSIGIAANFFSAQEQVLLRGLPVESQADAFFACWTRKEAYIKARGEGLSLPLDRFDVTIRPEEAPALRANRDAPKEPNRWKMEAFSPSPGYAGALLAEGKDWSLVFPQGAWDGAEG